MPLTPYKPNMILPGGFVNEEKYHGNPVEKKSEAEKDLEVPTWARIQEELEEADQLLFAECREKKMASRPGGHFFVAAVLTGRQMFTIF